MRLSKSCPLSNVALRFSSVSCVALSRARSRTQSVTRSIVFRAFANRTKPSPSRARRPRDPNRRFAPSDQVGRSDGCGFKRSTGRDSSKSPSDPSRLFPASIGVAFAAARASRARRRRPRTSHSRFIATSRALGAFLGLPRPLDVAGRPRARVPLAVAVAIEYPCAPTRASRVTVSHRAFVVSRHRRRFRVVSVAVSSRVRLVSRVPHLGQKRSKAVEQIVVSSQAPSHALDHALGREPASRSSSSSVIRRRARHRASVASRRVASSSRRTFQS